MSRWQNKRKARRETDAEMAELFPLHEKRSSHLQQSSEIVNQSHRLCLQEMDCGELVDQSEVFCLLFKLFLTFVKKEN